MSAEASGDALVGAERGAFVSTGLLTSLMLNPARRGEGSLRVLLKVVVLGGPESRQPFVIVAGWLRLSYR